MLTRRQAASVGSVLGLVGVPRLVGAQPVAPPAGPGQVTRQIISRLDYPGDGHATILMMVDIGASADVAWHQHPGIESAYLLAGGFVLRMRDQPDRRVQAGEAVFVPPMTPHFVRNGEHNSRLIITYVVARDQPLAIPVVPPG